MRGALTLLLLCGCSTMVDPGPYGDIRYPCPYADAEIGLVRAALATVWLERFGEDDATEHTEGVIVQCSPSMWGERGLTSGQTYDRHTVRIAYRGGDLEGDWPIRYTALSHELIHVVLWSRDGDPDAAHETAYWRLESDTRVRLYGDTIGCGLDPLD